MRRLLRLLPSTSSVILVAVSMLGSMVVATFSAMYLVNDTGEDLFLPLRVRDASAYATSYNGQPLVVTKVNKCNDTDAPLEVVNTFELRDGVQHELLRFVDEREPGCHTLTYQILVPEHIPDGAYTIYATDQITSPRGETQTITFETNHIEVRRTPQP